MKSNKSSVHRSVEAVVSDNVAQALAIYLEKAEVGRAPEIDEFLSQYPDIADQLRDCLKSIRLVDDVAGQFGGQDCLANVQQSTATLGDFHITHEIGRGGMGVVYRAEQLSLGRPVALKVLPFASLLDKRQLERFKNEARAAAMLRHPNIVSVYHTGCDRGVHYYAMELVEGQSVAEIIQALKSQKKDDPDDDNLCKRNSLSSDTTPLAKLSTWAGDSPIGFYRSVARLGIEVAEALQYAHQEGVIHRDIKPSNLLMDEQGKTWVSDFGLAQIHGSNDLTMTGDVLGTLRYMSPEQASGQKLVDQRTDIYSLGLTLHELLTLRTPFEGTSRQSLMHAVLHQPLPAPHRIQRAIPADVSTIIMKSIAKDPGVRYATARDFADDLQRFLDDKPILARRTGVSHHIRSWSRRNPILAASLTLSIVLLTILAIGGPIVAVNQARLARQAEANQQAVQILLDQTVTDIAQAAKNKPGMWPLQQQLWTGVVDYYEDLLRQRPNDTSIHLQLGRAYRHLGRVHRLMESPGTTEFYEKSIEHLTVAAANDRKSDARHELVVVHQLMSNHLTRDFRNEMEASFHNQRAIEIARELADEEPTKENLRLLSVALYWCGETEQSVTDAVEIRRSLMRKFGEDEDVRIYAYYKRCLANLHCRSGRWKEAKKALADVKQLLDARPHLIGATPESVAGMLEFHLSQGLYHRCNHDSDQSAKAFQSLISLGETLLHDYPSFAWGHECLVEAFLNMSYLAAANGNPSEAEEFVGNALRAASSPEFPQDLPDNIILRARIRFQRACLWWWNDRRIEATHDFHTSIKEVSELVQSGSSPSFKRQLALILTLCPDVNLRKSNRARALELATQAVQPGDGLSHQLLGFTQYRAGQFDDSITSLKKSCNLRNGGDAFDWFYLAMAYAEIDDDAAAKTWLMRAMEAVDQKHPVGFFNCENETVLYALRDEAQTVVRKSRVLVAPSSPQIPQPSVTDQG